MISHPGTYWNIRQKYEQKMTDHDMRIPDSDDSYTVRIAPGYISITDHNKPKVDRPKTTRTKPKRASSAPSLSRFTSKSRLALQKSLNEVKVYRWPTHYIVLTFPQASLNATDWKRTVSNLRRRVVERFPRCWFFWRLMPEKQRGVPVLHLLGRLEDDMDVNAVQKMMTGWWANLLGFDPALVRRPVVAQLVTGTHERLFMKIASEEPTTRHTAYHAAWMKLGRRWDVWNRKRIPFDIVDEVEVKHQCHEEIMRVLIDRVYRDIAEIEARLAAQTGDTDYDRLTKSLLVKRQFLEKLQFRGDILIFPGDDYMDLVRETLRDFC
jgi:hypothetical protein